MGMATSAARWLLIDNLFAWTGLPRPAWNDAMLDRKLGAFEAIVEAHFRHYQFYANSMIAIALAWSVALATGSILPANQPLWWGGFIAIEALFLTASRNNLSHYYQRTTRLLGTVSNARRIRHDQRTWPQQTHAARSQSRRNQGQTQEASEIT